MHNTPLKRSLDGSKRKKRGNWDKCTKDWRILWISNDTDHKVVLAQKLNFLLLGTQRN